MTPAEDRSATLTDDSRMSAPSGLATFLPGTLADALVTATYEFGSDLLYRPIRVGTSRLDRFIRDSLAQHLVVPGRSDFQISAPDDRLVILFCHEADIHLKARDPDLIQVLIEDDVFRDIPFEREGG